MATGQVLELWRWPVKSMAGSACARRGSIRAASPATAPTPSCTSTKGEWRPLTAREAPRLLAWRAAYPFAADGGVHPEDQPHAHVTDPRGHGFAWGDPRLRDALARDIGRPVRLRRDVAGIRTSSAARS